MDGQSYILRRLDDPWKLALWELDVAVPFVACLFLGVLRGTFVSLLIAFGAGLAIAKLISHIKAMRHPGYFKHLLWWMLPAEISRCYAFPPSHQHEMVG